MKEASIQVTVEQKNSTAKELRDEARESSINRLPAPCQPCAIPCTACVFGKTVR